MTRLRIISVLCVLGVLSVASAAPIVDGRFDPTEGYTNGLAVNWVDKHGNVLASGGSLWWYEDATTGEIYAAFNAPLGVNDNTYGVNSIGWGRRDHRFCSLVCSDMAAFRFTDADGDVVFEFEMDYLSSTGKCSGKYASLGVTGGDGEVLTGEAGSLLAFGTSLDYNFNTLGHVLKYNSPATDEDYTPNSSYPDWEFQMTYEVRVDGALFGNGFGGVTIPSLHNSPSKSCGSLCFNGPLCPPVIPEPTTLLLLGLGAGFLFLARRGRSNRESTPSE